MKNIFIALLLLIPTLSFARWDDGYIWLPGHRVHDPAHSEYFFRTRVDFHSRQAYQGLVFIPKKIEFTLKDSAQAPLVANITGQWFNEGRKATPRVLPVGLAVKLTSPLCCTDEGFEMSANAMIDKIGPIWRVREKIADAKTIQQPLAFAMGPRARQDVTLSAAPYIIHERRALPLPGEFPASRPVLSAIRYSLVEATLLVRVGRFLGRVALPIAEITARR
ncbi:MAG: hypothetical protein AABZ44_04135 [Elusimicrobiota bacterium]